MKYFRTNLLEEVRIEKMGMGNTSARTHSVKCSIASIMLTMFGVLLLAAGLPGIAGADESEFQTSFDTPMLRGEGEWTAQPIFTVGETINDYTPPGLLDGLGAYKKDQRTVRVFANHEMLNFRGTGYEICSWQDCSDAFTLKGGRVSFFDINISSRKIVDAGIAYKRIYDADGNLALDNGFLADDLIGLSRFCSAQLVESYQFSSERGLADRIFFTGEEDGGNFHPVGGLDWALDPETEDFWAISAFGRGAWENVTEVDTGTKSHVAFVLGDDTSPFDADNDNENEVAPLYLYVGEKLLSGDFLERNGLRDGRLFVWVSNTGETTPLEFRGAGKSLAGRWIEISNAPIGTPSENGSSGFDEYGYPTQSTLWTRAEALNAFGFSRPEDLSTNPEQGSEFVLASTGVDTYAVDPNTGNGVDTFGTIYTMNIDFRDINNPTGALTILYDGDEDSTRAVRSPDNLDWADDGYIYIQEDKAENDTLSGEPLFGDGAANPNEASIVRIDPNRRKSPERIASIDRSVVIDPTTTGWAVDLDESEVGEWESSGVLDVSTLFGTRPGTLFLVTVQAHGISDQDEINATSRLNDADLGEGGQLLFLSRK